MTDAAALRRGLAAVLLALALLAGHGAPAEAQTTKPSRPFGTILADWNRSLQQIEQYLRQPSYSEAKTAELRALLKRIRGETQEMENAAADNLTASESLLEALGAPPGDDAPPEPGPIKEKRTQYNEDIRDYKARMQQAQLTRTRADQLDGQLSKATARRLLGDLLTRLPLPYLPATIQAAIKDYWQLMHRLITAPREWWRGLPAENRRIEGLLGISLLLGAAVFAGYLLRKWLIRRFGRDPDIEDPSYSRRFFTALIECVARGIIPALIFGAIFLRVQSLHLELPGFLVEALSALCMALIFLFLSVALVQTVLAPDMPAWQLTSLKRRNAVIIGRRITLIVTVAAVDFFIRESAQPLETSDAFRTVHGSAFGIAENLLIVMLARRSLWEPVEESEGEAKAPPPTAPAADSKVGKFWAFTRMLICVVALAGIVSFLIGYARLGDHMNNALLVSAAIAALLFLLRGLLRELVGIMTRSGLARHYLALPHATRSALKFWLRALLDVVLFMSGAAFLLIVWGVPAEDLSVWAGQALTGFEIGAFTISFTDILTSLAVFAAVLGLTRAIQRALSERVLPQTHLATGVQHSLSAGFGYIGIILAVVLALSALGIDLSNVALIAGALSVGIGFGLQNIVNNFVSGLILLIERPIQVGDWVVVGANEGNVKRISVRATEIETFNRASVIIPNAELISNPVYNWTHTNKMGRIDVAVGVAYGSDTEKVRDILLRCAKENENALTYPEPFVLFLNFGESSLDFELRFYVSDITSRLRIASAVRFEIDRVFRENGVEIPFPQRVVHMAAGKPEEPELRE